MAPREGRVARPERRWGCRRGTPGAYRKQPSLFDRYHITLYDLPFPKHIGSQNAPLNICRISNGHISAKSHPIHIMFCSRAYGFRGRRDEWRYCRFDQLKGGGNDVTWLDLTWLVKIVMTQVSTRDERYHLLRNYFGPCSLSYGANIFLVDFSVMWALWGQRRVSPIRLSSTPKVR